LYAILYYTTPYFLFFLFDYSHHGENSRFSFLFPSSSQMKSLCKKQKKSPKLTGNTTAPCRDKCILFICVDFDERNPILFSPSIASFTAISVLPSLLTFMYLFCIPISLSFPTLSLSAFPRGYLRASTSSSTSSLNASFLPHLSPFLHLHHLLPPLNHIVSYLHHISRHLISSSSLPSPYLHPIPPVLCRGEAVCHLLPHGSPREGGQMSRIWGPFPVRRGERYTLVTVVVITVVDVLLTVMSMIMVASVT
jgi:hypothetical protein